MIARDYFEMDCGFPALSGMGRVAGSRIGLAKHAQLGADGRPISQIVQFRVVSHPK